jgi:hypothetical protein
LVAVDGSTITLSPTEGGFALALAAPGGAAQRSSFAFLSDRLGTISDDADTGHVVGFFRETDTGIEAQYSDGRTQSLVANNAGGISLTQHPAAGAASCVSWYPSDHVFGAAEKRAALEAYADRLGIAEHSRKTAHAPAPACAPAAARSTRKQTASSSASSAAGPYKIGMYQGSTIPNSGAAGMTPVAVRTSQVHMIDGAVAAPLAAISPPAAAAPPAAPVLQQAVAVTTAPAAMPDGHGASDCLTVENDGANIGFRNQCGYGVAFAYCIQKAGDPANDCGTGAKPGSVSANGYTLLLSDPSIKTASSEHDFRWVACSGSTASVVAHLDRADPPAGRCTRLGTS